MNIRSSYIYFAVREAAAHPSNTALHVVGFWTSDVTFSNIQHVYEWMQIIDFLRYGRRTKIEC